MTHSDRISVASAVLDGNEILYVNECLDTTWISSAGRFIGAFEKRFAEFCGAKHAISTNNGTTALHLALVALGVGPGDEVIVPTLTYIATANAVRYCGAKPVLADSEPVGMGIDVDDVARKVTSRTKAVIPVHLYGHPADMTRLNALAAEHRIAVVEDAAEAHGSRCDGQMVGALSTCATFSFFGNKIITTGEGGMVTTDDDDLAARLRLLRGQGMDPQRRYWFPVVGYNYRMTNIEAALGLAQLERIEDYLAQREQIGKWYERRLGGDSRITLPREASWAQRVNWLYTVLLQGATFEGRDALIRQLDAAGVETRPVFYPMHMLPPYAEPMGRYPVAEALAAQGLSLPTHLRLTEGDVDRVCTELLMRLEGVGQAA